MKIAVIPARGGSKRIKRKNIKLFYGKPMLAYAILAAKESKLFDHIIVSTDDEEIASIGRTWGAETPFLRGAELSDDLTPTVPVIAHAIKECQRVGLVIEYACCIYPCVPFLEAASLVSSFALLQEANVNFVYPVSEYSHPVQRAMLRMPNGQMRLLNPEHELTRTQDLPITYHDAGQYYWGKTSAWLDYRKMHTDGIGIVVPNWSSVDIDTPDDLLRAEHLYGANLISQLQPKAQENERKK
jgi:pseudaminic acid cytidylyltransferase